MNDIMENISTQNRKQTILRLEEGFLAKLKYYAKREDLSLNAYMESILAKEIERKEALPHIEPIKELSPDIQSLVGILEGKITRKDLDEDDRLAYLLSR